MGLRRYSILVAENNRAIAQALRFHLERAGFAVYVAHDGDQAAILAARQRFHLILTDLDLPIMSGQDFCRHLREDLRLAEVPLAIFASSGKSSESDDIVFRHDVSRIFHKPLDPTVVVQFAIEATADIAVAV